jgi:hypothetical protein
VDYVKGLYKVSGKVEGVGLYKLERVVGLIADVYPHNIETGRVVSVRCSAGTTEKV